LHLAHGETEKRRETRVVASHDVAEAKIKRGLGQRHPALDCAAAIHKFISYSKYGW